jgi:hypothetical protein
MPQQSKSYAASAKIRWIVEEYERSSEAPMSYAWFLDTQSEAETVLLEAMRAHGNTHMYSMHFFVEE